MMSMRSASSSLPMTLTAGLPAFFAGLGALEVPLARGVEVADHHERVAPSCR